MIHRNGMSGMLADNSFEWHATHAGRLTGMLGMSRMLEFMQMGKCYWSPYFITTCVV